MIVRFKSVGSAPIMKQNYYKITGSHPFSAVHTFLRKELGWGKPGGPAGTGGELVSSVDHLIVREMFMTTSSGLLVPIYQLGVCPSSGRYRVKSFQSEYRGNYFGILELISSTSRLAQSFQTDGQLIVNYR